jgi:hypothetical protein
VHFVRSYRLVDYFVVVSYGDTLEPIDPSEQGISAASGELIGDSAPTAVGTLKRSGRGTGGGGLAEAVAALGGAGGVVDADPEASRNTNSLSVSMSTGGGGAGILRDASPHSTAFVGTVLSHRCLASGALD